MLLADLELVGDLLVGEPSTYEREDFTFPTAEVHSSDVATIALEPYAMPNLLIGAGPPEGIPSSFRYGPDFQGPKDLRYVRLYRPNGDTLLRGDVGIRQTACAKGEDLSLFPA